MKWFVIAEARWAAAALALFLVGLGVQLGGGPEWLFWAAYLCCYAAGGWEPGLAGLRALRERTLDVDLLMVLAALGAAAIGQVADGALLIVIFATSGALEALATRRTEESVRGLLDLAPETATRVTASGEQRVPVAELAPGDVVLVRPGERVGADGTVLGGASEVNQAGITGEPMPADKYPGEQVFAGTGNGSGALRVRVDRDASESVLAHIAESVREARETKARTQLFVETVEQRYSIGMVAATVALFAIPLAFGDALRDSLLRAMTFMIVASPCAVVLATMPPLLAAIATAGRNGVLAKSAVVLEQLGAATKVAFDKTGTLTTGVPELAELVALPGGSLGERELLRLAAAAEYPSEHPLAAAVVAAARERGLPIDGAVGFHAEPGRGVRADVDGCVVRVGTPEALAGGEPHAAVVSLRERGHTAVLVCCDGEPAGVLGILDRCRPHAGEAVAAAARVTGSPTLLLTGDHPAAARRVAADTGIGELRAGLLPEQKAETVRELQQAGEGLVLVGDGVNDAPALAAARTGVAMGAAADLSLQTADAVVVRDELTAVPVVLALARRARRIVYANLCIAAVFILGLVLWDLLGELPLPLGVAGHEGSTVLVGLNGLRLLGAGAWRRAARAAGLGGVAGQP